MADPDSHSAVISWMTEELEKDKFQTEAGDDKRTR